MRLFSKCESGTLTGVDSGLYIDDRFKAELCNNKVFSPCHVSKHTKIKEFPLFVTAIAGKPGKSCDIGCEKEGFTCKGEYFDQINRCDLMDMVYFNDGSVHECSRGDNHAYPLADEGKMFIKNKVSPWHPPSDSKKKFNRKSSRKTAQVDEESLLGSFCKSKPKVKTASRLCPCVKEDVVPKKFVITSWLSRTFLPKVKQVCFFICTSLCILYTLLCIVLGVKKSYKLLRNVFSYVNIDLSAWKSSKSINSPRSPGVTHIVTKSPKIKKKKKRKKNGCENGGSPV